MFTLRNFDKLYPQYYYLWPAENKIFHHLFPPFHIENQYAENKISLLSRAHSRYLLHLKKFDK